MDNLTRVAERGPRIPNPTPKNRCTASHHTVPPHRTAPHPALAEPHPQTSKRRTQRYIAVSHSATATCSAVPNITASPVENIGAVAIHHSVPAEFLLAVPIGSSLPIGGIRHLMRRRLHNGGKLGNVFQNLSARILFHDANIAAHPWMPGHHETPTSGFPHQEGFFAGTKTGLMIHPHYYWRLNAGYYLWREAGYANELIYPVRYE